MMNNSQSFAVFSVVVVVDVVDVCGQALGFAIVHVFYASGRGFTKYFL